MIYDVNLVRFNYRKGQCAGSHGVCGRKTASENVYIRHFSTISAYKGLVADVRANAPDVPTDHNVKERGIYYLGFAYFHQRFGGTTLSSKMRIPRRFTRMTVFMPYHQAYYSQLS